MRNFDIFCPECGAIVIVTSHLDAVVCERCPICNLTEGMPAT